MLVLRNMRIITIIMALLFLVGTFSMVYAAGTGDTPDVGVDPKVVTDNFADKEFALDITRVSDMLGLDVEEVGTLNKVRHVVAGALSSIASAVFSGQVLLTFFASLVLNWSMEMGWIATLSDKIGTFMSETLGGVFDFSNSESPVFYLIFFAMIGVVLSLARMRVSEGFGKFIKIIVLVTISLFLMSNSSTVFNDINKMADSITKSFAESFGKQASYVLVWDINAIRPWKILQFGDMKFDSNQLDSTASGAAGGTSTSSVTLGQGQYGYNPNQFNGNSSSGQVENFDWKDKKPRTRWKQITNTKTAAGILSDFDGKNNDGGKMYQMLWMKPSDRDDAASAIASADMGYFELSQGVQGKRVGAALILLLLSLPLTAATFIVALIIIALKLVALFMFFLWPIVILWALGTNNMGVMTKWLVSVAMSLLLSIIVQFLFSMILVVAASIHSATYVSFGYWALGSAVTVSLFLGGFLLYPKIVEMFGGHSNLGAKNLQRAWTAAQLHAIREQTSGNGIGTGKGEGSEDGKSEEHGKFGNPMAKYANEDAENEQDEMEENREFGEVEPDEEKGSVEGEETDEAVESTDGLQDIESDDGLSESANADEMVAPNQASFETAANERMGDVSADSAETKQSSDMNDVVPDSAPLKADNELTAAEESKIKDLAKADAEKAMSEASNDSGGAVSGGSFDGTPAVTSAGEATGTEPTGGSGMAPAAAAMAPAGAVRRAAAPAPADKSKVAQALYDNELKRVMGSQYDKRNPTKAEAGMARLASNDKAVGDYIRSEQRMAKARAKAAKQDAKIARKIDRKVTLANHAEAQRQFFGETVGGVGAAAAASAKETVGRNVGGVVSKVKRTTKPVRDAAARVQHGIEQTSNELHELGVNSARASAQRTIDSIERRGIRGTIKHTGVKAGEKVADAVNAVTEDIKK